LEERHEAVRGETKDGYGDLDPGFWGEATVSGNAMDARSQLTISK